MNNREIVAQTRKGIKNASVRVSTSGKAFLRIGLPTFDAVTGKLNTSLTDLQNVFLEGKNHEVDDVMTGTYTIGLRYYSKQADGITDRPEPFLRYELIEEVDVDGERADAIHNAKLAVLKKQGATAGKVVTADEVISDKW